MNNNLNNLLKTDKIENGVFRITLDDQKNKNALSEAMMEQLKNSLNDASDDNSVKVVVIAASGDVFSSGHNLKFSSSAFWLRTLIFFDVFFLGLVYQESLLLCDNEHLVSLSHDPL